MGKDECKACFKFPLTKDEIGATKKLLGAELKIFYCIDCLADYVECTVEDVLDKIEEFKEDGCTLFK